MKNESKLQKKNWSQIEKNLWKLYENWSESSKKILENQRKNLVKIWIWVMRKIVEKLPKSGYKIEKKGLKNEKNWKSRINGENGMKIGP